MRLPGPAIAVAFASGPVARNDFAERAILSENEPQSLRAAFLKIGHHGSNNSTTPDFLDAVQRAAPQAEVSILRTDHNGGIHISTDGTRFEVTGPWPAGRGAAQITSGAGAK